MQSTGCIRQYRVPTILVMVARDVRFASKCGKSNTKNKKNHRVTRKSKLKNWLNHRVTRKSKQKIWLNRLFIIPLQPQIRKTLWRAQVKWCVNKAVMCWSAKPNRAVRLRYAPHFKPREALEKGLPVFLFPHNSQLLNNVHVRNFFMNSDTKYERMAMSA